MRNHMTRCKYTHSLILVFLLFSTVAQAGIFSSIIKAGKKIDVDAPTKSSYLDDIKLQALDMPGVNSKTELIEISPRNGVFVTPDLDGVNTKNTAFVVHEAQLPADMGAFNTLPKDIPIIINAKSLKTFSLQRGDNLYITSDKVRVRVDSKEQLKEAMWLLSKSTSSANTQFLHYAKSSSSDIAQQLSQLRNKPVVLAYDQTLKKRISESELKAIAKAQDLSLTLIETPKPQQLITQVKTQFLEAETGSNNLASFYSSLAKTSKSDDLIDLTIDTNQNIQSSIKLAVKTPSTLETGTDILDVLQLTQSAIKAIQTIAPTEEHQTEIDNRFIYFIPSIYTSTLLFVWVFSAIFLFSSREYLMYYWRRFLPFKEKSTASNTFQLLLINSCMLILRIISTAFLGYITFTHKVINVSVSVCKAIFRAIKWIAVSLYKIIIWPVTLFKKPNENEV